jgi:hypothetical protein
LSDVVFSKKSTVRSQVTYNLTLCGAENQRVKLMHKIEEKEWKLLTLRTTMTNSSDLNNGTSQKWLISSGLIKRTLLFTK